VYGLYCFTSCFTACSLLVIVCIVLLHSSLVYHYWAFVVLFHFLFSWFIITGHGLYCFTSCFTGSFLLVMISSVSLHASLVYHYWTWFVLFHLMLHRFILNGNGLYFSRHASLCHHYRAIFVLFDMMHHWFIIAWHGLYFFASWFSCSFVLGMVCIVLPPIWFILTVHGLYCFTSCSTNASLVHHFDWHSLDWFTSWFRCSFLLRMISIDLLHFSLVHHYRAWFVFIHFPHCFIITGHGLYCGLSSFAGSFLLGMV